MSLSPAQVRVLVNISPEFRDAFRRVIEATEAARPALMSLHWLMKRHHVRVQYRRKSRGHR